MIKFQTRFDDATVLAGLGNVLDPYCPEDPWPQRKNDGAYGDRGNNWWLRKAEVKEAPVETLARGHFVTEWTLTYRYSSKEKEEALAIMLDWVLGFHVIEATLSPRVLSKLMR